MKFKSFKFTEGDVGEQAKEILQFFNLSFNYAQQNPNKPVLRYAIRRLHSVEIEKKNWDFFESLLLKTVISETVTLPWATRILITYEKQVQKNKIKDVIYELVKYHAPLGHDFEVSWAMWMAKSFQIKIDDSIARLVFRSNSTISILIGLDIRNSGLISQGVNVSFLVKLLSEESLMNENWLLAYESILKGWLKSKTNPVKKNKYFTMLMKNGVSFYDGEAQLDAIKYKRGTGGPMWDY